MNSPAEDTDEQTTKVKLQLLSKPASQKRLDAIDRNLLETICPLDNGTIKASFIQGTLPTFPVEIWLNVLLHADLQTLTTFRAVSSTARTLVDGLYQYKDILDHYPSLLRAALATRIASWLTLAQLHGAFTSESCFHCEHGGEYIYLLNCVRVCGVCLQKNRCVRPISSSTCSKLPFWPQLDSKVPRLLTIPGKYGRRVSSIGNRLVLLDSTAVRKIARPSGSYQEFLKELAKEPEHLPYMCSIRSPWLNRKAKTTDWGYLCKTCINNPFNSGLTAVHNRTGFLKHVEKCENAQAIWASFSSSGRRR